MPWIVKAQSFDALQLPFLITSYDNLAKLLVSEPAHKMLASLGKFRTLPADTLVYCAHEYTQSNARFALHADPDNTELQAYAAEIDAKRARGDWTVPTVLERELATNPFLRADDPAMQARWGGTAAHETFAALRAAKDSF